MNLDDIRHLYAIAEELTKKGVVFYDAKVVFHNGQMRNAYQFEFREHNEPAQDVPGYSIATWDKVGGGWRLEYVPKWINPLKTMNEDWTE